MFEVPVLWHMSGSNEAGKEEGVVVVCFPVVVGERFVKRRSIILI